MRHWPVLKTIALVCFFAVQTLAQSTDQATIVPTSQPGDSLQFATGNLDVEGSVLTPFQYGGKIFFTATIPNQRGDGRVSRLYYAIRDEPAQLMSINPKEKDVHAAHATLNATGDRIYYTISKEANAIEHEQSDICYRDKQYDGTWGNIVKLPKHINKMGTINLQPACGYDLQLKKDLLFFVSDRTGGRGGFDIWYCTVERDGSFGEPINLPTNTSADEMTPHFWSKGQTLFFSSTMVRGLGGFDIYFTEKNATGEWQLPTNLTQANSAFDDLYFSFNQTSNISYLCSNRPRAGDPEHAASDFSVLKGVLSASLLVDIRSGLDSNAVYGCNIELEDTSTGLIMNTILRSEESKAHLSVPVWKKHRLIVSHVGFYPVFIDLPEVGEGFFRPLRYQIYLRPMK